MKNLNPLKILAATAAFCASASLASALTITEDFESVTVPALPTGWQAVGSVATTDANGNPGNSLNAASGGTNYLVNSGVALDATKSISGTFDFYIVENGNYMNGAFLIGDVQDGVTGDAGEFIRVDLREKTFGARANIRDGDGATLFDGSGNNNYEIATNTWYSASFTWTPTGGKTGDLSFSWGGTEGPMTVTGYSFTSASVFFGFGTLEDEAFFDNISITGTPFVGNFWDIDGATTGSGGATPTGTWDSSTTNWNALADGTGSTAAWSAGVTAVFAAGDDATGAYTVTVDGSQDIGGLFVEEGSLTLADGTAGALNLTATSGLIVFAGADATIEVPITESGGAQTLSIGGAGSAVISSDSSHTGGTALAINSLQLSGDNSAAIGGTTIASGAAQFDSPASIYGTAEDVTINSGGTMAFGGTFGGTLAIQTALEDRVVTSSDGTVAVDNNLAADFDFSTAGLTAAYLGAIADSTYTGLLTPDGTTYRLGGAGGKLTLTDTSGMTQASPDFDILGDVEISGAITAVTGTLTKENSGTLILSGANTYSANTTASGGTLVLAGSNSEATNTTVNAATLQLDSASNGGLASGQMTLNSNSARLEAVNADRAISNDVLLNSSPKIIGSQSLTINGDLTINNNRDFYNNIDAVGKELELAGQINLSNNDTGRRLTLRSDVNSSNIKFNVTGDIVDGGAGAGEVTLRAAFRDNEPFYFSGTNTYSGQTEILNGTLFIQGAQALSPNTSVRLNHTSGNNGKIWLLDDSAGTINLPNDFDFYTNNSSGNHTIFVGNNNTANGGSSSGTTTGSVIAIPTLNSSNVKGDTSYQEINIMGANDYSLQIDSVELNNLTARNAGNTTETRLNPTTASVSIGDITMAAGNTGAGSDGVPLLVLDGSGTDNEVTGVISDASDALTTGQPLPVEKKDSSTWTLSGANTYTGGTNVEGGTLTIDGSLADASMTISGGTVNGSGSLNFNVDGTAADQVVVTGGTLDISGLAVEIVASGSGLTETEYILVDANAGYTGTFTGLTGASGYALDYGTADQVKLVQTGGGTTYDSWSGSLPADGDANDDGVENAVAYALGAADPNADATALLPTSVDDGTYLVFTFDRSDEAEADSTTAISVEYGTDLTGWTTAVHDGTNVIITVTDSSPTDNVEVKLLKSALEAAGKLFARLSVVVTP